MPDKFEKLFNLVFKSWKLSKKFKRGYAFYFDLSTFDLL